MNNKPDIYEIAAETISLIIKELEKTIKFLEEKYKVKGSIFSPYRLVNESLLVHKDCIDYTILFRGFELNSLKVFLTLYKKLFETYDNNDNPFQEFSFRTLYDMSFNKIAILYSKNIPDTDKQRYKLISILDDFVYVYETNPQWLKNHRRLLAEKSDLFSKKDNDKIDKTLDYLEKNNIFQANRTIRNWRGAS